jgi:hypothetical protein
MLHFDFRGAQLSIASGFPARVMMILSPLAALSVKVPKSLLAWAKSTDVIEALSHASWAGTRNH